MESYPIVFIHYGTSSYLRFNLKCAKILNPLSRVILLGDRDNEYYKNDVDIEHFCFSEYDESEETHIFDRVFKFIAGKEHGREFWTTFQFKRWFYLFNFVKCHQIERFWTFDSDTIILSDLGSQSMKFLTYDCTLECNGDCMKGFINGLKVLKGYLDTINELCEDEHYLDKQREKVRLNPCLAFMDMNAFKYFLQNSNIKTIMLNSIINGETFDSCIIWEDDMERTRDKYRKKLFFRHGAIYEKHEPSHRYIKLNSINMSSVSTDLIEAVHTYVVNNRLSCFPRNIDLIRSQMALKRAIRRIVKKLPIRADVKTRWAERLF